MVAKSRISMFAGGYHRVIFMYLLFVGLQADDLTANAQGLDAGTVYLDKKESEVKWIAGNATLNNGICGSLDSCSAACSRVTCYPVIGGAPLQCTTGGNNEFYNICPSETCNPYGKVLVDYSRSYVTLPAPASTSLQTEVARDICLQSMLDSTFRVVSVPSDYNSVYFGSTSGALRAFPGRELNLTQCTSYDPRWKPWYLNGVSVPRDFKILVDVGTSMGNSVTFEYNRIPGTTYLDVTKNITLTLLRALSPQDYVEVIIFNSSNATSLGGPFLVKSSFDYFNPFGHPELAALVAGVNNVFVSPMTEVASNLNGAIRKAAKSFNQLQSLKDIIVLSNGLFAVNSTTFPSADLQRSKANLMVYRLPTYDDGGDPFLLNTTFQSDICSVNGSFELLDAPTTANPLYSLRSYFTYLAQTHLIAVGGNVTWSSKFANVSQAHNIITATYPAFGSDGLLIGVAGIDVVTDDLDERLKASVFREIAWRKTGTLDAPANINLTCSYQVSPSANFNCLGSPLPDSSAICPRTDYSSTFADSTCCNTCGSAKEGVVMNPRILALISIAAATLAATAIGIFYKFKTGKRNLSILAVEVDLLDLNLCELIVHKIEDLVNGGGPSRRKSSENLLNRRQCLHLSSKLSKTTQNIREILFHCRASVVIFKPALEELYRVLEKAKLLVIRCGDEDWCTSAVFQSQNAIAFQEILLDVSLCYNAIYEQARSISEERNLPEDLRQSSVFMPAAQSDVYEDQLDIQKRLGVVASGHKGSLKECLARYLLMKLDHTINLYEASTSDTCITILWAKETEPPGTWGSHSRYLGSGSGGSGVCSTKWMGIPCAKKDFHSKEFEPIFLKEASILAHLKHPCIVNFICCGNGKDKGDRFIAMELMEKSLADLILDQGAVYFSLPIVVDIMVQIARGMCYLHGQGVAHRDLKPENIVVSRRTLTSSDVMDYYIVKLADFGMSKTKIQVSKSNSISIPGVGTTNYRAPEVHTKAHPNGVGKAGWFKADVFSFGMTCGHVLSLKRPLGDTKMSEVYRDLIHGKRPELPRDCPRELYGLLKDCWDASPRFRPSFVEICTRLEAFKHKILRGFSTFEPSLQQGRSEEFMEVKIREHSLAFIKRPHDAINVEVEDNSQPSLSMKDNLDPNIGLKSHETQVSEICVEMMQKSSWQKSFSF